MTNWDQIAEKMVHSLNLSVLSEDIELKSLIPRALGFAYKAHEGQTRKGNGEPYILHPIRVALSVSQIIRSEYAIASSLLHDTLEDTETTFEGLEKEFGQYVAQSVSNLSEPDKSIPWRERKLQLIERIKDMDEWTLVIKIADKTDNINSFFLDYMKQGEVVMKNFNASLQEQIEMDKKIYEALKRSLNRFESTRYNDVLSQLKKAVNDLEHVEEKYKIFTKA